MQTFISGKDVFGVLPTGYGKSLCYACLPAAFDFLGKDKEPSIVVVGCLTFVEGPPITNSIISTACTQNHLLDRSCSAMWSPCG